MKARVALRLRGSLMCVLLCWATTARAADIDHIVVPSPQELPTPWTMQKEGYDIHIYARPDSTATDQNRSVLMLGMWSGPRAVQEASFLINPATKKPYDVIIGLGSDSKQTEINRVVGRDHLDASANATALAEAIQEHFGHPLVAHTLDLHSNGNTVGITALLQSQNANAQTPVAFLGVKVVDSMGPDVGYGGKYLDADNINALKSLGVESVDVYRISGDIVPELGEMSKSMVSAMTGQDAQDAFNKVVSGIHDAVTNETAAKDSTAADGGIIHYHDEPSPGPWLWWSSDGGIDYVHFISHYIDARAGSLADTPPPPPDVQKMAADEDALIEKALADNNLDELSKALHLLGMKLSLADCKADRDRLTALMQQLEAARVKLDRQHLDAEIQNLRVQQLQYLTDQQHNTDALNAIDQVVAVRERQKQDAERQKEIFAQWAKLNGSPQVVPPPQPLDLFGWLDDLLPSDSDDNSTSGNPNPNPNRNPPRPPPVRHAPNVPLPSGDPFSGT